MTQKQIVLCSLTAACIFFAMCRKAVPIDESSYDERLSGGAATVFDETSKAFGHALPGLNARDAAAHSLGDAVFGQTFVTDPAPNFGGLGPIFNNVSCISCHHNDGKGTPTAGFDNSSLLVRITDGTVNQHGGPSGFTGYGNQLQDVGTHGITPEAKINISYENIPVHYADGSVVNLRMPTYTVNTNFQATQGAQFSPRMAPPVFGLGLLENVPDYVITGFAAENKQRGDGITGHPNFVFNPQTNQMEIGRFGLKANTSTLFVQVANAFNQDMGITSSLFPKENCDGQPQYSGVFYPDKINLPDSMLAAVVFYMRSLAVPARRNVSDATVKRGQALFADIKCARCHVPTMQTGVDLAFPQLSNQRIHPYTDLLLHDMGAGLADGYVDFAATGTEWKTPALWGIGLFEKTNGTPFYMHDGRARSIEEAILWHGGEATESKKQFMALTKDERDAVIKFVRSL